MADSTGKENADFISGDNLVKTFDALSHPIRIKIMATLYQNRQHVSELARMVKISRPLLYMHLQKLESARLVESNLEISEDGKAMKFYSINDFDFRVTPELLSQAAESLSTENKG